MANGSAHNGKNHNNSASACPNSGAAAYRLSNASSTLYLKKEQVRAALETIDITPGSRLYRSAHYRAFTCGVDADDLLHDAVERALTSRRCPASLHIEYFLMAVMRSIASTIIAKRETAETIRLGSEFPSPAPTPAESLEFVQRADDCRKALEKVVKGSVVCAAVLDGIDQGLCGKALAERAGVGPVELATVRRMIKRRAQGVWAELENLNRAA